MIKIVSFGYEKANGIKSERVLVVSKFPNKFYEGTDISELETIDQDFYAQAVDELNKEFLKARMLLDSKFNVTNNYRRFDPSRMTNVVEEEV